MKTNLKSILPLVPVLILFFALVALTSGFQEVKISSYTGSGGIQSYHSGIVYVTIDTGGADTSGASFKSETIPTDNNSGVLQGYVSCDYVEDSTDYLDTLIVTLWTAMTDNDAKLAWKIACDTFDTSFYNYYSYTGDDTLFKAITWYEFNVFDSTSDSTGLAEDSDRMYQLKSAFNVKE